MFQPTRGSSARRPGFTIAELMVVIAIVATLAALTAGAILQVLGSQKKTATETIMQPITSALQQQWRATVDDAKQETYPPQLLTLANGNERRARVLWIKLRLKTEFPTRYEEAWDPNWPLGARSPVPLVPKNDYRRALERIGWSSRPGFAAGAFTESSACLLLALTTARRGQAAAFNPQDSLPPNAIADTDRDGLREFVDVWGAPLAFFRSPWGNADLQASNPAPGISNDPTDPEGVLLDSNWNNAGNPDIPLIERLIGHPLRDPATGRAYYMVPTIVSAGRDGNLGLVTMDPGLSSASMALDPANPGAASDNIFSYRLRQAGARGD